MSLSGSVRSRLERLLDIKEEGEVTKALMQARCDRGAEIALLLGLESETAEAIRALDEHWDGAGQPRGLRGEEIRCWAGSCASRRPPRSSTARAASRAVVARRSQAPRRVVRPRARRRARRSRATPSSGTRSPTATRRAGSRRTGCWSPTTTRLDAIASAFAGVVDAKSPWTYRHSDRASLIVLGLANALGADERTLRDLARAAMLHDIGKLAISNRILDKPAPLTRAEFAESASTR